MSPPLPPEIQRIVRHAHQDFRAKLGAAIDHEACMVAADALLAASGLPDATKQLLRAWALEQWTKAQVGEPPAPDWREEGEEEDGA